MYIFDYHDNVLCAESVSLARVATEIGTPFYCYSAERLRQNYGMFSEFFADMDATVHYSIKANSNRAVIRLLAARGAGADVTTAGELERALQSGIRPEKIVFNGVGKTRDEIIAAILAGVYQINVESLSELHLITQLALSLERHVPIALRINTGINSQAQKKNADDHRESKFGIDISQLAETLLLAGSLPGLELKGLAVHAGSHAFDYETFRRVYQILADMVRICRAQGVAIDRVDLGGGVGIPYDGQNMAPFSDYASLVHEIIKPLGCSVSFEPGRRLVGDAGVLVARVVHVKKTPMKNFLVLDAGMNDLICPAMYGTRHGVLPVNENKGTAVMPMAIVGPLSESKDAFGDNYFLPPMEVGDLVAILQAGAYGSTMASTYNSRPLVPEVLVAGTDYAVVRRRITVDEQMSWETLPAWLAKADFIKD